MTTVARPDSAVARAAVRASLTTVGSAFVQHRLVLQLVTAGGTTAWAGCGGVTVIAQHLGLHIDYAHPALLLPTDTTLLQIYVAEVNAELMGRSTSGKHHRRERVEEKLELPMRILGASQGTVTADRIA